MNAIKMGMTIEEAAETSGIGRNTMRKLVDWGKLPVLKVGRKTIIRRDRQLLFYFRLYSGSLCGMICLTLLQPIGELTAMRTD